jgi:hypothetical protein
MRIVGNLGSPRGRIHIPHAKEEHHEHHGHHEHPEVHVIVHNVHMPEIIIDYGCPFCPLWTMWKRVVNVVILWSKYA